MDEPENHLHPSVIIETIDRLLTAVPNGQIWISTHSISLLAHFDPSSIWYMDNNKISYAGNIPEKVLHSLLGDEAEIDKLRDFIGLPAELALNRYAFECLTQPLAVFTDKNDPQTKQISQILNSLDQGNRLKILDYGAGKGRLLASLFENHHDDSKSFLDVFDYVAYDEYSSDQVQCKSVITTAYEDVDQRYFNDFRKLLSYHDEASFDVIILCNVLHEIDPSEWIKLFAKGSTITKLLKENGSVLIVEDTQMPVGEMAHSKGFIVFDTPEFKQLFKIASCDDGFNFSNSRGSDRLKAHLISKTHLEKITTDTIINALRSLRNTARQKIQKIRKDDKSYRNGKIHAFWVQQFANTSLALAELTND